jgi:antitoxin component YwqK of YwqJK toxin-antitoxin module
MHGVATIWDESGRVYFEAKFDRGAPVWMRIRHDNGVLAERWTYAEDESAWVEEWYESGVRRASGRYASGVKVAGWSFWTPSGGRTTKSYAKPSPSVSE